MTNSFFKNPWIQRIKEKLDLSDLQLIPPSQTNPSGDWDVKLNYRRKPLFFFFMPKHLNNPQAEYARLQQSLTYLCKAIDIASGAVDD